MQCRLSLYLQHPTAYSPHYSSYISYVTTVEALVSDHRGNSEKWSQPELVAYCTRMGSRKRPRNKTIEGGRLRELLAERLAYVVGYLSYCSQILFYCLS